MDLENHHFSHFFKKGKNTYKNTKVKLSISYKDFHCFQLMGFAHLHFSPFNFSKKLVKKLTCEKTRISENPIKTNIISTCWPPKITTFFHVFFAIISRKLYLSVLELGKERCFAWAFIFRNMLRNPFALDGVKILLNPVISMNFSSI